MGEIRAVGFDLDGTLFDHRGSATIGLDALLTSIGSEPSQEGRRAWFAAEDQQFELWRSGRITFQEQRRQRLRTVLPALGAIVPDDRDAIDELFERYIRKYRAAWRAFHDSVAVVTSLRRAGYRIGVLTNGTQQQVDKLRRIGLLDLLDVVCTSERIGFNKPEPGAFLASASELGVAPEECLFVGDNAEHDVAGALSVGMQALLVDRYGKHASGIATALDAVLTSELTGEPWDGTSSPSTVNSEM